MNNLSSKMITSKSKSNSCNNSCSKNNKIISIIDKGLLIYKSKRIDKLCNKILILSKTKRENSKNKSITWKKNINISSIKLKSKPSNSYNLLPTNGNTNSPSFNNSSSINKNLSNKPPINSIKSTKIINHSKPNWFKNNKNFPNNKRNTNHSNNKEIEPFSKWWKDSKNKLNSNCHFKDKSKISEDKLSKHKPTPIPAHLSIITHSLIGKIPMFIRMLFKPLLMISLKPNKKENLKLSIGKNNSLKLGKWSLKLIKS